MKPKNDWSGGRPMKWKGSDGLTESELLSHRRKAQVRQINDVTTGSSWKRLLHPTFVSNGFRLQSAFRRPSCPSVWPLEESYLALNRAAAAEASR